jgi:glycerol-3-phosphate acyltransferase PlsY
MFLALAPLAVVCALPLWGLVVWLSGYVSLGSIVTAVVFPVLVRLTRPDAPPAFFAALALAALIVVSHRANLRRLVAGTENRFGRRARAGGGTG